MGTISKIPFNIELTDEAALEFMDVIEWSEVPEDIISSLSIDIVNKIKEIKYASEEYHERYVSSNGIQMLRCKPLNWRIEKTYADGTGPEIYCITLGGMSDMSFCTFDINESLLKIDGVDFKCDSFTKASEQVHQFAERKELRIGSLYF